MTTATETRDVALERSKYYQLRDRVDPIVKHYRDDLLVHDREMIQQYPGVPYIHVAYDTGTHIYFFPPHDDDCWPAPGEHVKYIFGYADRHHILKQPLECLNSIRRGIDCGDHKTLHYFNGFSLKLIGPKQAVEIAQDHKRRVTDQWLAASRER